MKSLLIKFCTLQLLLAVVLYFFLVNPPAHYTMRFHIQDITRKMDQVQKVLGIKNGLTRNMKHFQDAKNPRLEKLVAGISKLFKPEAELYTIEQDIDKMSPLLKKAGQDKGKPVPEQIKKMIIKHEKNRKKQRDIWHIEKTGNDVISIHFVRRNGKNFIYYKDRFKNELLSALRSYYRPLTALYFLLSSLVLVVFIFFEFQRFQSTTQAQEKEYSERLKEWQLLSAGVAHEIKNPLSSLSMFSELLSRKVGDSEPESEYLGCIFKEISRLNNIVSNYLSFSRPPRIKKEKHSLSGLISEMIKEFQNSHSGIEFKFDDSRGISDFFFDRSAVKQVLLNSMKNAAEAIEEQNMENGKILLRCLLEGRMIKIEVADNGPGLSEDPERVMQPFYTSKTQGSGLGLSISYQIIKSHGGEFRIKNNEKKGCSAEIYLPYQRSAN